MLSYDEIINISKQYRYNYNKEAKSHSLIDKDTKTELTNMDNYEIMRIKAAVGLNTYMKHIQSSLPLDDLPYHNTTEQSEWEKNFYEDFQKSLSKIALNGNFSTDMVINMTKGTGNFGTVLYFIIFSSYFFSIYFNNIRNNSK